MGPNTLIHNDYRVDNLLWDGDEVVVLDFQLSAELTADRIELGLEIAIEKYRRALVLGSCGRSV